MRETAVSARAWLLVGSIATGIAPRVGLAQEQGAHVGSRCPRLALGDYEELDARVLLWLGSARDTRPPPVVGCDDQRAWVEWAGRRWPLPGVAPLPDEVLDVLEAARREDATVEALAMADLRSVLPARSDWEVRARRAEGGGMALGWETELPLEGQRGSTGPSLDLAIPSGPLFVGVRESFRFAYGGGEGAFLDVQALLAHGAPFRPRAAWGAALRAGFECFVAGSTGTSSRSECVPSVAGGGRVALGFVGTELWMGVDAHARLSTLRLADVQSVAQGFGLSLTLGVAFVDWSRRGTR